MFSQIEFNTVLAAGVLCFICYSVVKGFLIWQKDQDRQAAEYWRKECAIQEYEMQFMQELNNRLVPRLVARFGVEFQDFLIARNIGLDSPPPLSQLEEPKPQRELKIHLYNPQANQTAQPTTTEKESETKSEARTLVILWKKSFAGAKRF